MIYLLLMLSLITNGILVWYIRSLIKNYISDMDSVEKFTEMLEQYSQSLNSLYKLEELYGDETLKKTITQTRFVIDGCREFRAAIIEEAEEEEQEERIGPTNNRNTTIKLGEDEKVTQNASEYKRVVVGQ